MNPPLVSCADCSRTWHSATMAQGLRAVGCCPRCGGQLVFQDAEIAVALPTRAPADQAPHLVLGLPRR